MNRKISSTGTRRRRSGRVALALAIPALTAGLGLASAGAASASTTAFTPIKNAGQSQLCLDVRSEDGLQNNGARLQLYHCTGVTEQKYFMRPVTTAGTTVIYELSPQSSSGKCLSVAGYSAFNDGPVSDGIGAQVVQEPCAALDLKQDWIFESNGTIRNWNYSTCLDTTGNGTRDHERVMTYTCNNNTAQHWFA